MNKNIDLGKDAREKLLKGITKVSSAVVCTLGPHGRNVVYDTPEGVISTKDGVSVAKQITGFENPIENLGAKMLKQASIQTGDKAGDGTTTSTLLAGTLASSALEHTEKKENAVQIKRQLEAAHKQLIKHIKENYCEDLSSEDQLRQIATLSSNGDEEVGALIANALDKVGREGVVHIEESKSGDTYLENVEGIQFDRGYKSHFFVTDNNSMTTYLNNPYILIADFKITKAKELIPILENISAENAELLIIAEDIEHEALATLIVNKQRGSLKVAAVKAPDFGDRRKLVLEDIAIVTGGKVLDPNKGMKLDKFDKSWFGQARLVTITKDKTTLVDGKGDDEEILKRVNELKNQIEASKTPFEIEQLQNRLAKMAGGISIIHVGGFTETEMRERKDRVDDALNATKAALEEGIIPGGGVTLVKATHDLFHSLNQEGKLNTGEKILQEACQAPFSMILHNAGYSSNDISFAFDKVIKSKDKWEGFDITNEKIFSLFDNGIIDPFKVCRIALENAVSVASTILLTECTITDVPGQENNNQNPMMPGMGGMF